MARGKRGQRRMGARPYDVNAVCPDCGYALGWHFEIPVIWETRGLSLRYSEHKLFNFKTRSYCSVILKRGGLARRSEVVLLQEKGEKHIPVGKRRERRRPTKRGARRT